MVTSGTTTPRATTAQDPVRAALLVSAVYTAGLGAWFLVPVDPSVADRGIDATRVAVAVAFLTAWRLWGRSGLTSVPGWRAAMPALPLFALPVLPVVLGSGGGSRTGWQVALTAASIGTVAFGEEAVFRGVVLRTLLARGARPAILGSAALFGAMHVVNLLQGSHPVTVAAQVLMAAGLGVGFAAVALATGSLWPLLVVHFLMDFLNAVPLAAAGADPGPPVGDLLVEAAVNVALGALVAGYGLLLVRRRVGLLRELDVRPA